MTQRLNYWPLADYAIEPLTAIERVLSERIEPRLLHLLKARASQINGCAYCLHMHTTEALADGDAPERLMLLPAHEESSAFDERERAALAYFECATELSQRGVPDAAFARLQEHFTAQQVVDLTIAAGMINLWNRVAVTMRAEHPRLR